MEWHDDAIVLAAHRHGETSLVMSVLSRRYGRYRGLVRGAAKSRQRGLYEPGNLVQARWGARLAEHLGLFSFEAGRAIAALVFDDPLRLAVLEAALAMAETILAERAPHPDSYDALAAVMEGLAGDEGYLAGYLRFELVLLAEAGFALDLTACAVTGSATDLAYVSPRTGRAVSRDAAIGYEDRLLVLPQALGGIGRNKGALADLLDGMALTGFFLERDALAPLTLAMPAGRDRLVERLKRSERSI